jgi:hypothetical protein
MDAAELRHELIPLSLATRVVSERVYGDGSIPDPSRLLGIAHAMAALVPLYAYSIDGESVRRLADEELLAGHFRFDGRELHFLNGRSPIGNIAVTPGGVEEIIALLTMRSEQGKPATLNEGSRLTE